MKLRIRALDSKQTLRIEIPEDSSLHQLKLAVAQAIGFPSPLSLRLSLNRSDELSSSSPMDSLASLGVAAGDLIFYSVETPPSASSNQEPAPTQMAIEEPSEFGHGEETMEDSDDDDNDDYSGKFPESCFVKTLIRVLSDDFGEKEGFDFDHKLIVCAVHSVFLESGFIGLFGETLRFPPSMNFAVSLRYTVPEILSGDRDRSSSTEIESVDIKFQTLNNFVNVYGSMVNSTGGGGGPCSPTYGVCLDERRFAPGIASLRANGGEDYDSERALFELWKAAKDGLALPLMIELCDRAGLPGPACLARLPADLQMRILELLPGADVARVGCVCKDLQYLTWNNELWRRKFAEEFGEASLEIPWRSVYAQWWWDRRRAKDEAASRRRLARWWGWQAHVHAHAHAFGRAWAGPPMGPWISAGGDHDRVPWAVPRPPFGRWRRGNFFPPHRNLG